MTFYHKPGRAWSCVVLGRTSKYRTSNLPNLQIPNLEPTEPLVCSWNRTSNLPNLLKTEPRTLLYTMWKNRWFFEDFPSKRNLEPTEPQKTERTSEPNQVRPNTNLVLRVNCSRNWWSGEIDEQIFQFLSNISKLP